MNKPLAIVGEQVVIRWRLSLDHELGTVTRVGIIRDPGGYREHKRFEVTTMTGDVHSFHAVDWSASATYARRPHQELQA